MDASKFRNELESLINRHSMENGSNTPDFMLANYLMASLNAFNSIINAREKWYGRGPRMLNLAVENTIGDENIIAEMPKSVPLTAEEEAFLAQRGK